MKLQKGQLYQTKLGLIFYDKNGKETRFLRGTIFIHFEESDYPKNWENKCVKVFIGGNFFISGNQKHLLENWDTLTEL